MRNLIKEIQEKGPWFYRVKGWILTDVEGYPGYDLPEHLVWVDIDPLEIDSDGHLTGQCIKGVPIVDTLTARQWTIPHGWREDNTHTIRHYYYPDGRWVEEELNYPYYDLCERLPDNHTRRPLIAALAFICTTLGGWEEISLREQDVLFSV